MGMFKYTLKLNEKEYHKILQKTVRINTLLTRKSYKKDFFFSTVMEDFPKPSMGRVDVTSEAWFF